MPVMPLKKKHRAPPHQPQKRKPTAVGHVKRQQQLFAAPGKDVEVVALDDAVCDVGHHHLECSGRGGQEEGYHASRHVI